MPGSPEDQRNAANIYTSLSSYVITASLGVIAAQAALATFVLDKRDHLTWFYIWMICGLITSVVSVVLGGRGVAAIASAGFSGSWTLKPKHDYFNYQALFCLLGMVLLLFSLFSGTTKPESPKAQEEIQRLNASLDRLQAELNSLQGQYAKVTDELQSSNCPPKCCLTESKKKRK
jgi:amino acid transporter